MDEATSVLLSQNWEDASVPVGDGHVLWLRWRCTRVPWRCLSDSSSLGSSPGRGSCTKTRLRRSGYGRIKPSALCRALRVGPLVLAAVASALTLRPAPC